MQSGSHHKAMGLLANFSHKIFHTCDYDTAMYASNSLGPRRETFANVTSNGQETAWERVSATTRMGVSISETYQPILQPTVFMSGLRCGGEGNNYCVDGIVIRSGQPFASGENFIFCTFSQK